MKKSPFYSIGAHKISDQFPMYDTVAAVVSKLENKSWTPVSKDFKSYEKNWTGIHFISQGKETEFMQSFPEMREVASFFKTQISAMMLYTTKPGTKLHPHIDMSGNLPYGALRFHIPIITNENVFFILGRWFKRTQIHMSQGEFWALDTSHTHSVENHSNKDRIHLVVQVAANNWVLSLLPPRGISYGIHYFAFWTFDVPLAIVKRVLRKLKILPPAAY